MTCENHVFVANVVVIDPTRNTMTMGVISRQVSVAMELNAIAKICKYRRLHKGHHFISMVMKVHNTLGMIWIVSSRNVLVFSTINNQKVIYPYLFAFSFLCNVLVLRFNVLLFLL